METATTGTHATENGGDQSAPTITEPMEEVNNFNILFKIISFLFLIKGVAPANGPAPGSGDAQQDEKVCKILIRWSERNVFYFKEKDEDGNEIKQKSSNTTASKKKKKEIDLPITPRVPGASRKELDRLIEQEVK